MMHFTKEKRKLKNWSTILPKGLQGRDELLQSRNTITDLNFQLDELRAENQDLLRDKKQLEAQVDTQKCLTKSQKQQL
eukprot:3993961-Ditylum_brightwellii.AAC.1